MHAIRRIGLTGFALSSSLVLAAATGELELSRHSIAGGGQMRSQGGDLELSATIGQSAAGISFAGDLELSAGFWTQVSHADCDEDGVVGASDTSAFVDCLAGPVQIPGVGCACFDFDKSGSVDLRDYSTLQLAVNNL